METSLRARKKAQTRQAISDVATRMFHRHGFEQVTLGEIAAAADVSVKTVSNYFPTKEDLFFDRADEVLGALIAAVRDRAAGTTVLAALRRVMAERAVPFAPGWAWLADPEAYAGFRAFTATEAASPALRARRLVLTDAWVVPLADAVADALGLARDDPRAVSLAALSLAVMAQRQRVLASAVLTTRADPAELERRVRGLVEESFARLGRAFAELDPPVRADQRARARGQCAGEQRSRGGSGKPVAVKLGVRDGSRLLVAGAPVGFTLPGLPEGVCAQTRAGAAPYDVILAFSAKRRTLERRFATLGPRTTPAGALWIAWPKKASGLPTDLDENVVRGVGLAAGLVDVKVIAIDEIWSGLKFVRRLKDR